MIVAGLQHQSGERGGVSPPGKLHANISSPHSHPNNRGANAAPLAIVSCGNCVAKLLLTLISFRVTRFRLRSNGIANDSNP